MVLQDPGGGGGIASCIFTTSGWERSLLGEVNLVVRRECGEMRSITLQKSKESG